MLSLIDFDRLESALPTLQRSYQEAVLFEHVVLDGFLTPEGSFEVRKGGYIHV